MLKRLVVLAALSGFLISGEAQAASACKGLSSSKCGGATACYWVKGYKTKKGTNVSAHCRAKPKSSSKTSKNSSSVKKAAKSSDSGTSTSSKKSKSSSKKKSTTEKKKKKTKKKKKPTS